MSEDVKFTIEFASNEPERSAAAGPKQSNEERRLEAEARKKLAREERERLRLLRQKEADERKDARDEKTDRLVRARTESRLRLAAQLKQDGQIAREKRQDERSAARAVVNAAKRREAQETAARERAIQGLAGAVGLGPVASSFLSMYRERKQVPPVGAVNMRTGGGSGPRPVPPPTPRSWPTNMQAQADRTVPPPGSPQGATGAHGQPRPVPPPKSWPQNMQAAAARTAAAANVAATASTGRMAQVMSMITKVGQFMATHAVKIAAVMAVVTVAGYVFKRAIDLTVAGLRYLNNMLETGTDRLKEFNGRIAGAYANRQARIVSATIAQGASLQGRAASYVDSVTDRQLATMELQNELMRGLYPIFTELNVSTAEVIRLVTEIVKAATALAELTGWTDLIRIMIAAANKDLQGLYAVTKLINSTLSWFRSKEEEKSESDIFRALTEFMGSDTATFINNRSRLPVYTGP